MKKLMASALIFLQTSSPTFAVESWNELADLMAKDERMIAFANGVAKTVILYSRLSEHPELQERFKACPPEEIGVNGKIAIETLRSISGELKANYAAYEMAKGLAKMFPCD